MKNSKKISIIGDGGWGTTLAIHLAKKSYPVLLWGYQEHYVNQTNSIKENKKFLPGIKIPSSVHFSSDLSKAIDYAEIIILAIPSEYLTSVLLKIKKTNYQKKIFLSVVKGIHPQSFKRMSELIVEYLNPKQLAILSGPTIASELARGLATTAVISSSSSKLNTELQQIFNSKVFRIYTNKDVVGTEVGGSIKNVIAIACGICDGLGLGTNAKSALLTRGLAELTRLGIKMGGKQDTFYGLTGLGDLVTTCTSPTSRNRSLGEALAKGKKIKQILGATEMVAEGVITSKAAYFLSKKLKIDMPISEQVYLILFKNKNPRRAFEDLMNRLPKVESARC